MTASVGHEEMLYFNGIDGDTGKYAIPPMAANDLVEIIRGESPAENLNELRFRYQQATQQHLGVKEGVDPKNLAESGWGIIFAHDADPAVKEALSELIEHRRKEAGQYFKIYEGEDGHRPEESKTKFLARHGAGPGPADPDKVPYYLLIVGDPERIPNRFQSQLDVQYAVGRIYFETPDEYANYARSVVAAETGSVKLPRDIAMFSTANKDDMATQLSTEQLMRPMFNNISAGQSTWNTTAYFAEKATKAQLAQLLGGDQTPALLFSASHGMQFAPGSANQLPDQGALLCQDWPGPKNWTGPVPPEYFFAGEDLASDASLLGLIAFFFACYGAGTPHFDEFAKQAFRDGRREIAPRSFLAQLPLNMLSHPRGGALAVIGHIDRAWSYSFNWPGTGGQTQVFESTMRRLLDGHPVGSAVEYFNERYAELATMLNDELEEIEFGKRTNPYELSGMWTASNDARGYALIGDPAVRLPVVEPKGATVSRPAVEVASFGETTRGSPERDAAPDFIKNLRSADEQKRANAIEEALAVVEKATEINKKLSWLDQDETELDEVDKQIREDERILKVEVERLAAIAVDSNYPVEQRVDALSILENLGAKAAKRTLVNLKSGALSDPDVEFRAKYIPAIVAIDIDPAQKIDFLRRLLREGDPPVQMAVMEELARSEPPATEALRELWQLSEDESLGSEAASTIFYIQSDKDALMSEIVERLSSGQFKSAPSQALFGELFLEEEEEVIGRSWSISKENKQSILTVILATLAEGTPEARERATAWLVSRADEVPSEQLDRVVEQLKELYLTGDDIQLQRDIISLSETLATRKKAERHLLEHALQSSEPSDRFDAIKTATDADDEWPMRILIQEWVQWIAYGRSEEVQFVEEASQKMRAKEQAVLPLLNVLTQDFQPSAELVQDVVPSSASVQIDVDTTTAEDIGDEPDQELRKKIVSVLQDELANRQSNVYQSVLKRLDERANSNLNDETIRRIIVNLIEAELKERELWVHRRVTRQLSEMSNPHYFEYGQENEDHRAIKTSLTRYGVPVLARILPESDDDEVRENLAYALGNVGGRESVDALARAVVGEERTRANRQKLLAKYYLEPSKQRSDEASDILKSAVEDAKRTLWIQQILNILVLVVGLIILVSGLAYAAQSQSNAELVGGILVGLGGFAGIIVRLVKDPLDRIQNAMANLVQLETAFTSFIWELNLNGTYIQSQYVAEGILTDDDVAETVGRIEDAMNLTMDQVAVYTDKGRQILTPHITSLSPAVGKPNTTVAIFGQHLKRDTSNRKDRQRIAVALNHVPVSANDLSKDRNVVEFQLPSQLPPGMNPENSPVWVSLVIDGWETNSLPFRLITAENGRAEDPDS